MQREVNCLLRLYLRYINAGSLMSPIRIPLIGRLTIAPTPEQGFVLAPPSVRYQTES